MIKFKIFILLTLSLFFNATTAHASASVVTFDCELKIYVKNADAFLISCADGNELLNHIKWSNLGLKSATGYGYYVWNDCTPYCSKGKIHSMAVKIVLDRPLYIKGHVYLSHLTWQQVVSSKNKMYGRSGKLDLYRNFLDMGGSL